MADIFKIKEYLKTTPKGNFEDFVVSFQHNLRECQGKLPKTWKHQGSVYSKENLFVYSDNKTELHIIAKAIKGKDMFINIQNNITFNEMYPITLLLAQLTSLDVNILPLSEYPLYKKYKIAKK